MKETKKILCHFSFYDQVRIQEKLEEMAEQGWMVDKPGNFAWTFKRIEPKNSASPSPISPVPLSSTLAPQKVN